MMSFAKFRHILTTFANYLLLHRGSKGKLAAVGLERPPARYLGAHRINEFTWKDILDSDACTECKRCQDRCPAYNTKKPLSPMKVVKQIKEVAFNQPDANLIETVSLDALWSCTACLACQEICPASIGHVDKIIAMRRHLVLMKGTFPCEAVGSAINQTEINGNPFGMDCFARGEWAVDLGVKPLSEDPEVDVLYFVGCYASFDQRGVNQQMC